MRGLFGVGVMDGLGEVSVGIAAARLAEGLRQFAAGRLWSEYRAAVAGETE